VTNTSGQSPPAGEPRIGTVLAGNRIVRHVADGAMGRVYEATPEDGAGEPVRRAVKVLHPHVAKDEVSVERFKREFETAELLDHPHIVRVFDFGETGDGSWYLAMEFLEGEELGERLRREQRLPLADALRIGAQIGLALDHAHSFGVIHRDLKPDNVFLCRGSEGDVVKILDFGSVKLQVEMGPKLTAFGTTLGSPYYMSPEQAMGLADVDPRTDVFALAAITYEMLAGRVPFEGKSVAEILVSIVNADPTPLSQASAEAPKHLDAVFEQGLRKDKSERFATASAFASALAGAAGVSGGAEAAARTPLVELARTIEAQPQRVPEPPGKKGPGRVADRARLAVDASEAPAGVGSAAGTGVVIALVVTGLALLGTAFFLLAG